MKAIWYSFLIALGITSPKTTFTQAFTFEKFGKIEIVRQSADTKIVILILYSDPAYKIKGERLAQLIAKDGNAVATINLEEYAKRASEAHFCQNITSDLADLNKSLQQKLGLKRPAPIVLLGKDRGANVVELAYSQTGNEIFSGFIAMVRCKNLPPLELCKTDRRLPAFAVSEPFSCQPGINGEENTLGDIMKAHRSLRLQSWLEALKDRIYSQTPIHSRLDAETANVEVFPTQVRGDHLVVMYSGDGGWAKFVDSLADRFAADGIPVVGIDSLKYFWNRKTPVAAAQDLNRTLEKYMKRFHVHKIQLIGFSFGADVLPFIFENLPKKRQDQVDRISLLSLSHFADFEFHLDNWISNETSGMSIKPELKKLGSLKVDCAYGEDSEKDSLCPEVRSSFLQVLKFPGGHFLNWDTEGVYHRIAL